MVGGPNKAVTRPYDRAASDHRVAWRPGRSPMRLGPLHSSAQAVSCESNLKQELVVSDLAPRVVKARATPTYRSAPSRAPSQPHGVNGRMRWQPRSSRFDREVTVPNLAGISVTPSEIGGLSSSHVVSSEATSHVGQARLGEGFIGLVVSAQSGEKRLSGQIVSSGAASHVGQARFGEEFIGLVVSAQSGEKRLNGHLDRSLLP
ncbi:hypothetical protein Taro_045322 [Colocasia esculenta]|uniref:Uncharacterized protein n=1 Tax=Colocasia esculenta TaxID=4460 RepID=A0A843WWB5_COLES|nr:hypothetical protein [Colocasia esculenta]